MCVCVPTALLIGEGGGGLFVLVSVVCVGECCLCCLCVC